MFSSVMEIGYLRLLQRAATHPSMLNRAIRRNKRFENRRANMIMKGE